MLATVLFAAVFDVDDYDPAAGLSDNAGLPDAAVRGTRDRVKAAPSNSGFPVPGAHLPFHLP